ncbi:SusD/RagB family nutrient-binding outer membrane lipoprotein [Capnocytophaga sp.]|uniref:SusD/RagB family nutrient-binding outer membrane lipoprotein n=1 Tax=Capnocytophaga sp. TaxID=44737 RepID=UPI0026DA9717|nr:SusD/RagB family nutrient-binding outer membrane lipoprotein [Capnocytophaga sp.]MDO5105063.1 SusD/RagB family nutrient-binding outer membrane lipoprotein [Capnocytophaga sp.]
MKPIAFKTIITLIAVLLWQSCSDFEEINKDPNAADRNSVLVEGLFNSAVADAQLSWWNRDILFHRTWLWGARYTFRPIHGPQVLQDQNNYMTDYWASMAQWINDASQAIEIGEERIAKGGNISPATNNYVQMARIYRAYLFSEVTDMFGPYPAKNGFKGKVAEYDSVEDIYAYIEDELKLAVSKLDSNSQVTNDAFDAFYGGNIDAWKKYANSLRLRYAMRFSNVGDVGKNRFEAILQEVGDIEKGFITHNSDNASVAQSNIADLQDPAGSIFALSYIGMEITSTLTNIAFGLGGISVSEMAKYPGTSAYGLPAEALNNHLRSPNEYLGLYLPEALPTKTNVETAGYLYDYIPSEIDPRILVNYHIPGHHDELVNFYVKRDLDNPNYQEIEYPTGSGKKINTKYTFSSFTCGDATGKTDLIGPGFRAYLGRLPAIGKQYRGGDLRRVYFGAWETYFLLAEAAHYGWQTGKTAKEWYELGIRASFEYHKVSRYVDDYLQSESYNRIGTSVKFEHTQEVTSVQLKRKVYATGNEETVTYNYPKGVHPTNNDVLSKIMTQKYLAQNPWQPFEATNDYRRTGLPFFENPYLEGLLPFMPFYTDPTKADIKNVYRRVRYPINLKTKNPTGYERALQLLGGADKPETPLIWQKR